jgi:hypothetical protein
MLKCNNDQTAKREAACFSSPSRRRTFKIEGCRSSLKIILSRKGFDSASGKIPNPVFPGGRMLSLPIPDKQSQICYSDISWHGYNVGSVISDLTRGRIPAKFRAHLDPDLCRSSLDRLPNWRPLFGQAGQAQVHLDNHGVGAGDMFLFFGWFRRIEHR